MEATTETGKKLGEAVLAATLMVLGLLVFILLIPLINAFAIYWTWKLLLPYPITWLSALGFALLLSLTNSDIYKHDLDAAKYTLHFIAPFLMVGMAIVYLKLFG